MSNKKAKDLIIDNNENARSTGKETDENFTHDSLEQQTLKQSGFHEIILKDWSKEKLIDAAETLELPNAKNLSREELIINILRANEPQKKA